jgi:hypothetical protein
VVEAELPVTVVVEAMNRCLFDGLVHALDLTVRPRMFGLGQAMVNVMLGASELECVGRKGRPLAMASLISTTAEPPAPRVVEYRCR